MRNVHYGESTTDGDRASVMFAADFSGGDYSMGPGHYEWGFTLQRGHDDRWHIVDAGVS